MVLIDTSAFIEFLNKTGSSFDSEVEKLISEKEEIALADIILLEILQGIKNEGLYNDIKKSLLAFPVFSLNGLESYVAAANIYRKCRKRGITVRNTVDLLIAQIALENNLILLHNDKDFDGISKVCNLRFYAGSDS